MPYEYGARKQDLFTEAGQVLFLKIRDHVKKVLKTSGAIRMEEAISVADGDSWLMLACVDRLVELRELREIPQPECAGQHRVFVAR